MQIAALLLSAVLAQAAPTATTGGAESVTTGSAAVTGTLNPGGDATTYQFEYGTSSSYGLTTAAVDAGSGTTDVSARATLSNLTNNTTYHFRLVATNAAGVARGSDKTFKTASPAAAPSISSRAATAVSALGATLNAGVNPRSLATTMHFEYGTSTAYGAATPEQTVGAGGSTVSVSATIGDLKAGTKYYFRAVATSPAGIARGGSRSFTTPKAPTGVAITPSTIRPVWGSGLTIAGSVSGAGSTPVALEKQDWPYSAPYAQIATVTANSGGAFNFTVPALLLTTHLRVVTRTAVPVYSPVTTASVAAKVGLKTKRLRGKRVRIEGAIWPAVPNGRVSLQRQTASGKWGFYKRGTVSALDATRSRYRISAVSRRTRATNYRVVVIARNGGANVPGTSRTLTVPKR
ncbi:fibronectin type III domain-containing protein [Solirubrobacter ginsenosidimutans]|uniref:Fibronectin type III domain-containing protein n=1 Tax=Solirubrobacter ginsenosidimutans TaxID=490573 RepID=A0A9X3S618_9ACTN|nr:fibronectin type III domain-containing protein [Solirubrobacter ginsenosidimutans]MDA0166187.1 fibronectin type III domain-containing protein [Solirubrobacter ginsenosidimutans]